MAEPHSLESEERDHRGTGATMAERVFEEIQDAIVRGDVAPGTRLAEPDLARQYGVSRGPLREALQRLEARHLVERIPHVGARVAALSFERLIDIYRAREALEGMACRLATEHGSEAELAALEELLEEHGDLGEVRAGVGYFQKEGDLDFHFRIARASGNAILEQLLCEELYHLMRLYRYKFSGFRGRPKLALEEHRRIVAAMREGDADFAELLMRRHIAAARRTIEAAHQRSLAEG
ncbi:MAG: GntR family transcriptional regulator [Gammaproteobacteria bacterium]|nr:GntR family transcriptional regulator [Gammaproteobacteria bacterium]